MKAKWILIASILLGMVQIIIPANAKVLHCDGCTNQEMYSEAVSYLIGVSPGSPIGAFHTYVVNIDDGAVRKYTKVQNVPVDPEEVVVTDYLELAVEPEIEQFIADLHEIAATQGGRIDLDGQSPSGTSRAVFGASVFSSSGFPSNAYENIQRPDLEANVQNYIDNKLISIAQKFATFMNAYNPFAGFNPDAILITIQVRFQDGSYAVYTYNNRLKQWDRVPGMSRDSNNNVIPETPEDVYGSGTRTYHFSGPQGTGGGIDNNLNAFINHATLLGAEFSGPAPSGYTVAITCTPELCFIQILE